MTKTCFVAKSLLLDASGEFLLLTRSDTHPTLAGYYDLPGGTVESGEEPGAAVIREIFEETGIEVSDVSVLYATTMMIGGISYPTLLYLARHSATEPPVELSWEHGAYEWAPIDKFADVEPQIAPTYRHALEYIRTNKIVENI
jgi:8-oxo-dGTP diphosphatase